MTKKYLMIVGTEYPAPGLGNWNYAACFIPEDIAQTAALNPSSKVYEVSSEEEAEKIHAQLKASIEFQLWANEIFHKK